MNTAKKNYDPMAQAIRDRDLSIRVEMLRMAQETLKINIGESFTKEEVTKTAQAYWDWLKETK
jgi:hypothetical protein